MVMQRFGQSVLCALGSPMCRMPKLTLENKYKMSQGTMVKKKAKPNKFEQVGLSRLGLSRCG